MRGAGIDDMDDNPTGMIIKDGNELL